MGSLELNNLKNIAFTDMRIHYLNNHQLATNVGIGLRALLSNGNAGGLNLFYDHLNGHLSYRQIGGGLEFFHKLCAFSLNTYFPFGKTKYIHPSKTYHYDDTYMAIKWKKEKALAGFDIELKTSLNCFYETKKPCDFFASLGTYYYRDSHHHEVLGAKWRFGLDYKPYFIFEVRNCIDRLFKMTIQGVLSFYFPFGKMANDESEEIQNPIQRQEIIALTPYHSHWEFNF